MHGLTKAQNINLPNSLFGTGLIHAPISEISFAHIISCRAHRVCQLKNKMKSCNLYKKSIMISSTQNASLADYYFGLLKNLSASCKMKLISKLSQSLNDEEPASQTSLRSLFGAFKSEVSADEIIAELRLSRVFNRNIESL